MIYLTLSARRVADDLTVTAHAKLGTFFAVLSAMPGDRLLGRRLADDVWEAMVPGVGFVLYTVEKDTSIIVSTITEGARALDPDVVRKTRSANET
jgi:hypothetical protein